MYSWTAAPIAAEGPRKGEPSSRSMRYGPRPQPALLVRGSSRRIMTMRFRPANIRVINRRVCSCAAIGPAVQNNAPSSPAGTCSPLHRPSNVSWVPERCSPSRVRFAAPKSGAPLTAVRRSGRRIVATGGSGGNTSRACRNVQTKRPASLLRRKAGLKSKPLRSRGLDRSLHIRTGCGSQSAECADRALR
jgi:hypothetical protein